MPENSALIQNGFLDPLLECLVLMTKLYKRTYSHESLKAGLPLKEHRLTPTQFVFAAKRAKLNARIVERPLSEINNLVLPAVLQLHNNQACIAKQFIDSETLEIISPDSDGGTSYVTVDQLQEQYNGFAIFVQPEPIFEDRADDFHVVKPRAWFWETLWRFKSNYYRIALAALLINIFSALSPLFVMNVYDRVIPNNANETLWVLASGIAVIYLFDFAMRTIRGYLIDVSGKKADILLSTMIFQQVLHMRMEAKPSSTGSFANNLQGFESIRDFCTSATLASIIDLPFILIFVGLMFVIGGPVAIVPLLAIPVVIIAAVILEKHIREAAEASFKGAAQKQAILVESLNGLETIKTLRTEGQVLAKWEKYISIVSKAGLRSRFFSSLAINFSTYVMQMITVVMIVYGTYVIESGHLTMGGLIACVMLSGRALAPLTQIASLITRFQQSKLGLDSLNQVMSLPQERDLDSKFLHCANLDGHIEFKNVSFSYPGQETKALDNISFHIKPGEKVALIGRIGSGKSTIQKLMMGLYQVTDGGIYLNSIDSRQIDPVDIRRSFGYISQDCNLFYGSLRENITTTKPWATDEEVMWAAQLSGVAHLANRHPQGYQMRVGEYGQGLSGGQRQAIAIARTLLQDPAVLIMDEPTSAMDHNTEMAFIHNLQKHLSEKTLVVVTHKTSMLALVDRIIVIDQGKIAIDDKKEIVLEMLSANKVKQTTP